MYVSDPRSPGSKTAQWSTVRGQGRSLAQQPTDAKGGAIVVKVEITDFPAGVDVFDRNFFVIRCPSRVTE